MAFNIFTTKRVSCFGQYDRIDDLITFKLRGDKCPVFWQCLAAEFHSSTVIKRFDPLFVSHIRSLYLQRSQKTAATYPVIGPRLSGAWRKRPANSMWRRASHCCFISSSDLAPSAVEVFNTRSTRSHHSPEGPASQSIPACVAWPHYSRTMCKREQSPGDGTCLKSGQRCPMSQETDAYGVQNWILGQKPCRTTEATAASRQAEAHAMLASEEIGRANNKLNEIGSERL
jgi:hypothetical protein